MDLAETIASLDWPRIRTQTAESGYATTGPLLSVEQCKDLAAGYEDPSQFRSRIIMSRHGFGRGEYQYYNYPLPPLIQTLREALYPQLAGIANEWNESLGIATRFPLKHSQFQQLCRGRQDIYGHLDENAFLAAADPHFVRRLVENLPNGRSLWLFETR